MSGEKIDWGGDKADPPGIGMILADGITHSQPRGSRAGMPGEDGFGTGVSGDTGQQWGHPGEWDRAREFGMKEPKVSPAKVFGKVTAWEGREELPECGAQLGTLSGEIKFLY